MLRKIKALEHQRKISPNLISKIMQLKWNLENRNSKYIAIKSQRIHLKESDILNIACF